MIVVLRRWMKSHTGRGWRPLAGALAAAVLAGSLLAADVAADPADDALAQLHELSRQAEQTTEAIHSDELALEAKLAAQKSAEHEHAADQAALHAATAQLAGLQDLVNRAAVAFYIGGQTDVLSALMTAGSPQQLIDQMTAQRVVAAELTGQMADYRRVKQLATTAAQRSAESATRARTAAEQAAAVRAQLQAKQSRLQAEIAEVQAKYVALTPAQRATLADPGPVAPPAPGPARPDDPAIVAMPPAVGSSPSPKGGLPPAPAPSGGGAAVVQAALTRVGAPYSWGAAGPNAFDCSGLIMWAFEQIGKALPHSSQALAAGGQPVPANQMQPGDIVTFYDDASHAGIYVGNGQMVHASTYGTPVKVALVANAPIYNVRRW